MLPRSIFGAPARALAFLLAAALASTAPALAQATTSLSGTVTDGGAPVPAAAVTASGANLNLSAKTDERGTFRFSAIPVGTYTVTASAPKGTASLQVDVPGAGAAVTLSVTQLQQIGRTTVTARPPLRGSGTDLSLNAQALTRSPAGGSLPNLLVQLPGAARGAHGVVHLNGDHGDINYIVDGVQIPQALNRTVGTEFDPNDIAFVEALQGAYPAQYGERFASVINVNSRNGAGPPGFIGDLSYGSYADVNGTIGYHTNVGKGSLIAALRNERSARGLDPPNFDSPHNRFSDANQFLRLTLPTGPNFVNVTVSRSYQTYQIPPDVAAGAPARIDDNQTQEDLFAAIQFRRPIGGHGSLSFGPSYKRSRIRDFGDPANDFASGMALDPGAPTACANALHGAPYGNGTCAYSLRGDRTAIDVGANLDYQNQSAEHGVAFGAYYDATHVAKDYAVTLQPGNFLAPLLSPATPDAPYTVTDRAPNLGHLSAAYVQDSWKMGPGWQLDYGVRGDAFAVSSTQFRAGFGQLSPRIKLTRFFGARKSAYAYYGRFFTPFSLENVSPSAAFQLNLPLQAAPAQFDLRPQRDSVYELGGHLALGRGDFGLRIMQKNATDLIDDTQVGTTNLHQDINYAQGRISTQSAYYQLGLARGGRFHAALTHTYAVNKGCETQLLAPCFGTTDDWTPSDHDQRIDLSAGFSANDRRDGWFALDAEYGSGLSSDSCPPEQSAPCKRTPHLTFDAEKGFALGRGMALTLRVRNLLNDRYLVTYRNAQGDHYAPPRTVDLGLRLNAR
ncbi:MAG: hypothetical protein QOI11_300 [Candidatus Eremiobacteraeota bacterium]|nr:hypothetical protein [Candidatus Eremiobacteraeota bacterium]